MDEWVPVVEDVPLKSLHYKHCSDNVMIRLTTGEEVLGFYEVGEEEWYNYDSAKKIPFDQVVAWRSM